MTLGAVQIGAVPLGAPRAGQWVGFSSTAFGIPTSVSFATGWVSSQVGTPNIVPIAVGFVTGNLGSPSLVQIGDVGEFPVSTAIGTVFVPNNATGWEVVRLGTPNSPYTQTGTPSGFSSTALGSHTLVQICYAFASPPSTAVSSAYTAVNQTAQASSISSTQLGTPVSSRRLPAGLGRLTQASGFSTSAFGVPIAVVNRSTSASGFTGTAFGTPVARGRWMASGFRSTKLGSRHSARQLFGGQLAAGFLSGGVGQPSGAIINLASSMPPTINFGTPLLVRSTTC